MRQPWHRFIPANPELESWPLNKGNVGRQKHPPPPTDGTRRRSGGRIKGVNPTAKQGTQAAREAANKGSKHCPNSTEGEEDEIQVVGVHQGGLTLPATVKEGRYDRDGQGRDAVPLLAGEGRMIIKKLLAGTHEVQKITKFQKPGGRGMLRFRWNGRPKPPPGGLSSSRYWRPPLSWTG